VDGRQLRTLGRILPKDCSCGSPMICGAHKSSWKRVRNRSLQYPEHSLKAGVGSWRSLLGSRGLMLSGSGRLEDRLQAPTKRTICPENVAHMPTAHTTQTRSLPPLRTVIARSKGTFHARYQAMPERLPRGADRRDRCTWIPRKRCRTAGTKIGVRWVGMSCRSHAGNRGRLLIPKILATDSETAA